MAQRYDAVATRKYTVNGEERTQFTTVGSAFAFRDKEGFTVRLNAIPAPTDGEYTILLMPPKPKEGQQRQASNNDRNGGGFASSLDDDIPFAAEWRV